MNNTEQFDKIKIGSIHDISIKCLTVRDDYKCLVTRPTPNEFKILKEDIDVNGIKMPLILNKKSELIDGYTRYDIAIQLEKTEVPAVVYDFKSEAEEQEFIIQVNLNRRHLNSAQKGEIAMTLLAIEKEKAKQGKIEALRHRSLYKNSNIDESDLDSNRWFTNGEPSNLVDANSNKSIVKVAKVTSIGKNTLARVQKIKEVAETSEEVALEWNKALSGQCGVNQVYKMVRDMDNTEKKKQDIEKIKNNGSTTRFHHGDFRSLMREDVTEGSVDLILTDPPYSKDDLHLWNGLGVESYRYLKEGGFLIAYTGRHYLPQVMSSLSNAGLEYYWVFTLLHRGPFYRAWDKHLISKSKLILVYYKKPFRKPDTMPSDIVYDATDEVVEDALDGVICDEGADKSLHVMGQNSYPFKYLLEKFTKVGDLVVDPFLGGGTTMFACMELGRNFVGYEVDEKAYRNLEWFMGLYDADKSSCTDTEIKDGDNTK
ncbi:MAG: ParB N-terminal domain-containing protein [Nitrospirae bacterium]|nr:ParB N-terminal domain-containing protein [Nitrospirota bacterium]